MDFSNFGCSKQNKKHVDSPQYALEMLMEGNRRFVSGEFINSDLNAELRMSISKVHNPFAAIVGCSDARIAIEKIFDYSVGDVFVIRTAGNTVGCDSVMGSVEFAVEGLAIKVLIVLGHRGCVAVSVAMSSKEVNICAPSFKRLIENMRTDFVGYAHNLKDSSDAVEYNVKIQINKIMSDNYISEMVERGDLIVVGAIYDSETGIVSLMR